MSFEDFPELAKYQREPRQAPSGGVAKTGVAQMRFIDRGDKTIMRMYRKAPLLVQQALYWDEALPNMACVYIITTSGCVLQGDRLNVDIQVEDGACAYVSTQSATKVHEMDANYASQLQRLKLTGDAYLEYMPAPTIPHRHTRYAIETEITIDPQATLLMSEIMAPGRKYHGENGELFAYDLYATLTRAQRPDGKRLFTERLLVEPGLFPVRHQGSMAGYDVFGNVILLTPSDKAAAILKKTPAGEIEGGGYAGANTLPNDAGLIYKVIGTETRHVKACIRAFWQTVRREVKATDIPPTPLWG